MKNLLIVILSVTALALAGTCFLVRHDLAARKTELATLHAEAEQQSQRVEELQQDQQRAEANQREMLQQAAAMAARLQARAATNGLARGGTPGGSTPTAGAPKSGTDAAGLGSLLSKMMDDPDIKKVIREQQRVMMDSLYGPLCKQLGLTPEETEKFKELIGDNMMKSTEKAATLIGGLSSTNRAEMVTTLAAEQKNFDDQVRAFLGDARYAQYKEYQQTLGERTQLAQFRQQTAGSASALTDQQTEQLLAFMKEEKLTVAAATAQPVPGADQTQANLQAVLAGGEQSEKLIQTLELVNERVYARARDVLTPEQLEAFGRYQTNQLQMTRLGLNMARKFMVPNQPDAGATGQPR